MPYTPETRKTIEAREKLRAAHRRWWMKARALNTETWQRRKEKARKRATKYQEKRKEYSRRMRAEDPQRGYAYSRKHRLKKAEAKAGRKKPRQCEVCGNDGVKIHFDHCHQTGTFRGWICFHCNSILGHCKDDPLHLQKLIAYLTV